MKNAIMISILKDKMKKPEGKSPMPQPKEEKQQMPMVMSKKNPFDGAAEEMQEMMKNQPEEEQDTPQLTIGDQVIDDPKEIVKYVDENREMLLNS